MKVRIEPETHVRADARVVRDRVEVPALVPQLFAAGRVTEFIGWSGPERRRATRSGAGSSSQRVEVEDLLGVAGDARHEHVVAALRALDDDRRSHGHEKAEKTLSPVPQPALLPGQAADAVGVELLEVLADKHLL